MSDVRPKKRYLFFLFLIIGIVSVPIFYLNCSGPNPNSTSAASILSSGVFPYQMHIDTIAYMSCSNLNGPYTNTQNDPTNAFFSFKVAALNSNPGNCTTNSTGGSGVCLTQPFIYAVRNLAPSDQTSVLQSSTYGGLYPDLSIRPSSDLVDGSSVAYIGTQCTNDCGNPSFADANLLGASEYLSSYASTFFNSGTDWHNSYSTSAGEIPMSGQISFTGGQNDGAGSAIRGAITQGSGNYFLTTEFADAAGTGQAGQGASTNGSNGQVYGYGYRFSFTNGQYQSTGPARAISNVYEYDLTTGQQTSSSWTCENFEILYPGDLGRSSGVPRWTPIANPQPANALQAAALQMLPNWQFDEYGNFVMPPTSVTSGDFCEGTLQMHPQGSYTTPSNTLYYDSTHSGGGGTCSTSLNNCPHLVSVCVRNN